ncbi:hypothetical protein RHOSPDRAFT_31598 [Rhodotorula sp. JG-1b]|nr:hypothetical protein RHOSPDRAFT_31598 [Rhodotorula sp. JG-1b]
MSYATPTRKASYTPSIPPSEFSSPVLSPSFTRRVSTASSSAGVSHASPSVATADRKKRSRLRDYYGLAKAAPVAGAGQALDIDVPGAFDADAYFNSLASTASLPDLLRRENELLNEIRELDGERQSLVYNHHHELIDASDTIRKMKSRAEALDHSLESLKSSFESISQLSTSLATVSTSTSARTAPNSVAAREPTSQRGETTEEADDAAEEALKTPKPPHRRHSSQSDNTHATSSHSAARKRSTSSATSPSSPSSVAPPALPTVPFSPVLHLSALLALPIILRSLLLPSSSHHPTAAATTTADHRARADSLWGTWEPALRSWEDAGVPGVKEVGMECRDVLRSSAAQRRSSMSALQSPV